jgi:YggT family protein
LQTILCPLLQLYTLALILRAVMSWFPVSPNSGIIPVLRALDTIINPLLMPLRRVIPPAGMFDLSFLVLLIIVQIVHGAICGGAAIL